MNAWSNSKDFWNGQVERRVMQKAPTDLDVDRITILAKSIPYRTEAIIWVKTWEKLSEEVLISWSEKDIEKYLSDIEMAFQIFLSQLYSVFESWRHGHVNLELDILKRPDFIERIHPFISRYRRKSDRKNLTIEITERWEPRDVYDAITANNLRYLRSQWFRLLVDDYGSTMVSRLMLQRYRQIFSWVKIPHQLKTRLLQRGWGQIPLLSMVPPTMEVIAEGAWLMQRRWFLPSRIRWVQDPNHISLD